MKKLNYLSLAAIATFGLASCSSDEPYNGSNDQNVNGEHYMAVTIRTAGMGGTRATTDGGFEGPAEGSNEGTVTAGNTYFYFFDADGNPFQLAAANIPGSVSTNVVQPTKISETNTDGEEPTITGVLVLGKAVGEGYVGTTPAQMLCVANPIAKNLDAYANKSLDYVLNRLTTDNGTPGIPTLSNFVMTSSTYVDGANVVTATQLGKDVFKTDPKAAEDAPVTIYLERVAAKVRAHGLRSYAPQYRNAQTEQIVTDYQWKVDNKVADLQVTLNGWRLTNITKQSYAFKHVAADGNYFTGWNNADLHRCYWALSNAGNLLNKINSFNIWDEKQWTRGNFDSSKPLENIAYTYENTQYAKATYGDGGATSATDRMSNATGILVRATVEMKGADGTYKPVNLTRWAGAYYTEDELKRMIIASYNVANGTTLDIDAVSFKEMNHETSPNRWYAQVKNGDSIEDMINYTNIMWWQNGATSYYLNIEHLGGLFGVVRNHIYDYTFNGVVGLGVPGNDPENPEKEDETFLAARVAILNWHVISNNVVLE